MKEICSPAKDEINSLSTWICFKGQDKFWVLGGIGFPFEDEIGSLSTWVGPKSRLNFGFWKELVSYLVELISYLPRFALDGQSEYLVYKELISYLVELIFCLKIELTSYPTVKLVSHMDEISFLFNI